MTKSRRREKSLNLLGKPVLARIWFSHTQNSRLPNDFLLPTENSCKMCISTETNNSLVNKQTETNNLAGRVEFILHLPPGSPRLHPSHEERDTNYS